MPAHPLARPGPFGRTPLTSRGRGPRPLAYRFWAQPPEVAGGEGELARDPKVA